MTYAFSTLEEALRDLPALRDALGERWIECESGIPPLESNFPLARSLRIAELRGNHETLNRRLAALEDVPGSNDWKKRLRTDGPGYRELMVELAFADLLHECGIEFEHPKDGPDFSVALENESLLLIEATTPRVIAWDDELSTALWILSRQYGHSVRSTPLDEDAPILSEEVRERTVQRIVSESIALLEDQTPGSPAITQTYPELGLKIEWTPSEHPYFSSRNSPHSSHFRAFNKIWEAAEAKAKQLKSGGAHVLLIGTNQMSGSDWLPYVHAIRNEVPFYGDFDWDQIHPQVNMIIFFEATYGDGRAPAVDFLIRPKSIPEITGAPSRFIECLLRAGGTYERQSKQDDIDLVRDLTAYEARKRQASVED